MDGGIGDFITQIPVGLILMFCGSGTLLVGVIAYFVYVRGRRARAAAGQGGRSRAADADMPDLDALTTVETYVVANPPSASGASSSARPTRTGTFTVALSEGGTAEAVEVCAILRDVVDGGLIVQIGNKAYRHPPTGADADFMRRYDAVLRGLAGKPAPTAPAPPPAASAPTATSEPEAQPTVIEPEAAVEPEVGDADDYELPSFDDLHPPSPTTPPSHSRDQSGVPMPGDLPKFKLPDTPEPPRRGRRPPSEPIPEINIAAAIETYLQFKRQQTGALPGRRVHIRSGVGGAVVIEVDGRFFDAVSDIDDDEVRTYISQTIAEWQERQ